MTIRLDKSPFIKILLFVASASALATISSVVFLAYQGLRNDELVGDLSLRFIEFRSFASRIDPIDSDPKLGYPLWAYLTTAILFASGNQKLILVIFVALQLFCLVIVSLLILRQFSYFDAPINLKLVLLAASMPWFALRYQATYMNYGIVVMLGISLFVYCKNKVLRVVGLVIALIKPALCIPVILLSPWLHGVKIVVLSLIIISMQGYIASSWINEEFFGSIARPLTRYVPTEDGKLKEWFLSGDYGILSKFVRNDLMTERDATLALLLLAFLLVLAISRIKIISRENAGIFSFLLIPLVSFHRYHDIVLIYPALASLTFQFLSANDKRKWLSLAPVLWSLQYRGSGSGSLYTIAIIMFTWILYSPSFHARIHNNTAQKVL